MKLSIVIPTRNRDENLNTVIHPYLEINSDEFEIIIAMNSDTHDRSQLSAQLQNDKRVRILNNNSKNLSMKENWERAVDQAIGEWIIVIGDDDIILLESLMDFLKLLESQKERVEVFSWPKIIYCWPDLRKQLIQTGYKKAADDVVSISLKNDFQKMQSNDVLNQSLEWKGAGRNPGFGISIYHGIIRRSLLNNLKLKYGSHFIDELVDFDYGYRVMASTESLYWSQRPFSVLGACAKSNSAGINNSRTAELRLKEFYELSSKNLNESCFDESCGTVAVIYNYQNRFRNLHNIKNIINYNELIKKIIMDCQAEYFEDGFLYKIGKYDEELSRLYLGVYKGELKGIKFLEKNKSNYKGLSDGVSLIVQAPDFSGIDDLYRFLVKVLCPIEYISKNVSHQMI